MREMRIWPQYAAKCCKNAGKFFPDVIGNRRVRFNFRRGTPAAGSLVGSLVSSLVGSSVGSSSSSLLGSSSYRYI